MRNLTYQLQIAFLIWLALVATALVWTSDPSPKPANSVLSASTSPVSIDLPPYPSATTSPNLRLTAASFTSLDVTSGKFLLKNNADSLHAPASTAKLMLAWVVHRKCSLDQIVTISESFHQGAVLGLKPAEQFTLHDILYALLLPSDNDAAVAAADGCFGSQQSAVAAMNEQAKSWNLGNTHFANVHGLDNLSNYSTAHDLALLAKSAMTDPVLSQIVSQRTQTIASKNGQIYELNSTNHLLGSLGVNGIKTGSTDLAGENFIARADLKGHQVITVVLGSTDRFADTKKLLLEIMRVYSWQIEPSLNLAPVGSTANPIE